MSDALLLLPRRVVPLSVRLLLTVPQLLYLPWMLLAPDAALGDLAAYGAGRLDGEWLHEAWPLTEAIGFWMPVPLIMALSLTRKMRRCTPAPPTARAVPRTSST